MKVSGYIFVSLLVFVFALPLAAQVNDTYVIPVVAEAEVTAVVVVSGNADQ